jgi:hypothetical protein
LFPPVPQSSKEYPGISISFENLNDFKHIKTSYSANSPYSSASYIFSVLKQIMKIWWVFITKTPPDKIVNKVVLNQMIYAINGSLFIVINRDNYAFLAINDLRFYLRYFFGFYLKYNIIISGNIILF